MGRAIWTGIAVLAFTLSILLVPLFRPNLAIYVTVVALGFAVALQKYVSSFAGFFVLRASRLFDVGDRIRIGTIKGDVRHLGLLHFVLDEVGEGDKSGGELTGRILHIPNHIVLDQPVLNYCQDFSTRGKFLSCSYMFDEVRLPLPEGIPVDKACHLLEEILLQEDRTFVAEAKESFGKDDCPNFVEEAGHSPRVMLFVDATKTWLIGRFVTPVRGRNDLKSRITLRFLEAVEQEKSPVAAGNIL